MSQDDVQEFIERDKKRFSNKRDLASYSYSTKPLSSSLPYSTVPKIRNSERIKLPQPTLFKGQKICFNDAVNSVPFYERSFQYPAQISPRDYIDYDKDPRYGIQTKLFVSDYV